MSGGLEPPLGSGDPANMAARIAAAPEQIEQALSRCETTPLKLPVARPDLVAAGAMGGSAIAADLTAALYADRLPRPILSVRDYHWPACVTAASLAVLSSYSGATEETLALYREAGTRGVPRVAFTTGGLLAEWCGRDGVSWARLPAGMPPRAALFASWVTWTQLLRGLGWIEDPAPAWREAALKLAGLTQEWGPSVPESRNAAKRLARELKGRFVFIYCGSERLGPVATRVRNQLNENAKLLGHSAMVPELNHNEIVGWEEKGPLGDRAAVLLLRDAEDPPEVATRLAITAEYVIARGAHVAEIGGLPGERLARMASMVLFGDYLSLYLALLNGVDPTPIASIDAFKRRLKEGAERGR